MQDKVLDSLRDKMLDSVQGEAGDDVRGSLSLLKLWKVFFTTCCKCSAIVGRMQGVFNRGCLRYA